MNISIAVIFYNAMSDNIQESLCLSGLMRYALVLFGCECVCVYVNFAMNIQNIPNGFLPSSLDSFYIGIYC